jgi:hypothetical protein
MKLIPGILFMVLVAACNNSNGNPSNTNDTTNINIKTSSPADAGPNNGLGDTNIYHKQDTLAGDSGLKK